MNKEESLKQIKNYGYLQIIKKDIQPSYYLLDDKITIIEIYPDLLPVRKNGNKLLTNIENRVNVFSPESYRILEASIPGNIVPEDIIEGDVSFEPILQPSSIFILDDNNTELKIRVVVNHIQKTRRYNFVGESIYIVNSTHAVTIRSTNSEKL